MLGCVVNNPGFDGVKDSYGVVLNLLVAKTQESNIWGFKPGLAIPVSDLSLIRCHETSHLLQWQVSVHSPLWRGESAFSAAHNTPLLALLIKENTDIMSRF